MFKRSERLNRTQFSEFFNRSKRIQGEHITVLYSPAPTFFGAVVVGKKVAKKAHDRNRIRRRLYACLRVLKLEHALTGAYILVAKPKITSLSKRAFMNEVPKELGQVVNTR